MKEGKFLSEALRYDEIVAGKLNMVVAKTGQGKTTMATKVLPQKLNLTDYSRILFLIDTNMGKEMLLKDNIYFQEWNKVQKENKICVLNYHQLGSFLKEYKIWSSMFDLIIADEFHNLYKYARIDLSKMINANPDFSPETISMMLSRESSSYRALETIKRWSESPNLYVVAMTATPEQFLEKDKELNDLIKVISVREQLVSYEILARNTYTNAEEILVGKAVEGEKRLIFTPNIALAKKFKNLIEENTERKALALWSPTNELPMDAEQYEVRRHLIDNESYPDDLDDLFLTEAYSTGWNLSDSRVKTTIVHSGNKIIETQFVGRNRQDIEQLFVYDSKGAENEKRLKQKREQGFKVDWVIPEEFLNKPLNTEDRKQLVEKINFPKKWTSLKKWIEETQYYSLEKKTVKGKDLFTIKENSIE